MAYDRVNWANGEEGGTPTSADNFNTMDRGIADAHDRLDQKPDHSDIPDAPDLSGYVTESDLSSALESKADSSDIPDVSGKADKSEIPDVSGLASQSDLDALESRIAALEPDDSGDDGE